jgi:alpha-beta hydrolase superfamily lysophospholipase
LGHCYDGDGFNRVTADIDAIHRTIRKERPGLPIFILGHSWGSFITQNYIETYGGLPPKVDEPVRLAGCILSGTRGPGGFIEKVGRPVSAFIAFIKRGRKGSKFIRGMADGPYNKPCRPNRTLADWLSRDNNIVDAFLNDPLCGKLCSSGFYRDLAHGLGQIHQNEALQKIRRDLPVYVFAGSSDPVGEMGESPTALVNLYRSLGIADLDFVLYPDARHETINETNREEVAANLLAWLNKHVS